MGRISYALLVAGFLCTAVHAADVPAWDGLEKRDLKGFDHAYVRPGAVFDGYARVMLDGPVDVAFAKNWDPNEGVRGSSGRLSEADLQRIRDRMAKDFRDVLSRELRDAGYEVVESSGAGTLRLRASLTDVFINAPDRSAVQAGRTETYKLDTGRVTLELEMFDGPTGQLLARIVDEKQDQGTMLEVANSVTNSQDFRRAVHGWSRQLVKALDAVGLKRESGR